MQELPEGKVQSWVSLSTEDPLKDSIELGSFICAL